MLFACDILLIAWLRYDNMHFELRSKTFIWTYHNDLSLLCSATVLIWMAHHWSDTKYHTLVRLQQNGLILSNAIRDLCLIGGIGLS